MLDLSIYEIRQGVLFSNIFCYDLLLGFFIPFATLFFIKRRIPLFLKNTDADVLIKPIPFFFNFQVSNSGVEVPKMLPTKLKERDQNPIYTIKLQNFVEMPNVEV